LCNHDNIRVLKCNISFCLIKLGKLVSPIFFILTGSVSSSAFSPGLSQLVTSAISTAAEVAQTPDEQPKVQTLPSTSPSAGKELLEYSIVNNFVLTKVITSKCKCFEYSYGKTVSYKTQL
jgi:hypothetical protein